MKWINSLLSNIVQEHTQVLIDGVGENPLLRSLPLLSSFSQIINIV